MSWRQVIPQDAFAFERAAVTPYTFVTVFVPAVLSFYVMAVLVQLPRTRLYRVALLPVVFWTSIRANMSLDFSSNRPTYAYLNQGLALCTFIIAVRSTAWAFSQEIYTRKSGNNLVNGHIKTPIEQETSFLIAMWNAGDLITNLRVIGWTGPPKMYIPTPYFRVQSRLTFCLLSMCQTIFFVFATDMMSSYIRVLGPDTFGTPEGGTIFDPSLPPLQRYTKSSIVTLVSGFSGYCVIGGVYYLHATLFTVLFQQCPSQWPPLFNFPWFSTSLTSFWSRRWHQLFREFFVMVGSRPMERYFGRVGSVLGAFALSGVLHDVGLRGMGRGADTTAMMGFFLLHGVGVMLEDAWKRATGKRVGGVVGLVWVYATFIWSGHIIVDAWAKCGLLGSEFFPEAYRPTTLLLNWVSWGNGSVVV